MTGDPRPFRPTRRRDPMRAALPADALG
jgi:hypothetical protein